MVLHKTRRLEKAILSQVRYKSHLIFCHLSKQHGHLPRFLRFKPPLQSAKAKDIAKRTGWAYLRLIISQCHNKLKQSTEEVSKLKAELSGTVGNAYFESLMDEISQMTDALKQKLLLKQNKKLPFLAEVHEHEEVKKRWVVNASQHDLKDNEVQLLRKGLNFALTPNHVQRKEIIASVEQSLVGLPGETKDEIRVEVSHILKHANPLKDNNTTTEERRALRDLKQNSTLLSCRRIKETLL